MSLLSRRQAIVGAVSVAGAMLAGCDDRKTYIPPNASVLFGMSFATTDTLTLATQRLLLTDQSMAREFPASMISPHFPAINEINPGAKNSAYRADQLQGFRDYRLPVAGLVARPLNLSLADLRNMPSHSQITQHSCERGWSAIAKWTGVRLAHVLALAGLKPEARWVMFQSVDGWWDCLDLFDALHPQTLLAYGMNDDTLPVPNGAPLRLRVERALGWKSMKFITSITVLDRIAKMPDGKSSVGILAGFPWYSGI
jgi:DMSO/TMAO reductase YedYZ molybdopterin-dependent catalytic subunit